MTHPPTTAPGPGAAPLAPVATGLVPVFVRLKLSLLRNGLRQSGGRRAAYVASAAFALLVAALQLLGLVLLRGEEHAATVSVLLVAVLALGWAVLPLFFPSGDETLDPTRLVMLPLRPRPLVRALLVSSLVGIGPLFTLCLALGTAIAVARGGAAVAVGAVAVPLVLLLCVALARAVAAANIRLLTSRKGRDLAVLSGLVIAVGAQLVNFGAQRIGSSDAGLGELDPAADVVGWIPPASALSAVHETGEARYGIAAAQLALSVVALVLLLRLWQRSLTRLMTTPDGSTLAAAEPSRTRRGGSLAGLLPPGRTGTVMERTLRYVWRDPKTKAAWVTLLAIGLIVPLFNALQGTGSVYIACFAAGMLGIQMYNQFGQDTSAFWMVAMTIASTRDAYDELRGRAYALLVVTLPYAALVTVMTAALLGAWRSLPEALGLTFALLGAMLATGAWASARFPYSIPQEGYKNAAPGQGGLVWISLLGGMLCAAALCAPLIALAIWLHASGHESWSWLLLPVGTGYGAAVTALGLRLAAPRVAARLPEILTAVSRG
ncbi:transporter [Streptomyces spectabilis]|uniref:ABC-2 type transport system permease protein n=1 Tax=Streptomyces spectabilis TaxID=68270 RepID=A0A5P2X6L0_STRST|nr:transporter [Streptomyces spectabilis]MBB5106723.1 ABC-2 type transport system permease protein [Streptomyces spectabilis]MCI3903423.1 transporter [Streptomyces spectabilis]QEV60633.1 transporter [Streptomyces spectabilis]GGV43450.1 transporter [Streptomyces spectabilis]